MKKLDDLTAEHVRSILDYNPETGVFKWKWRNDVPKRTNARLAGKATGTVNNKGYLQISINGHRYLAHRLAWLFVHGGWPSEQIDHIDGVPANNRIDNLRLANNQENQRNSGLQKNNATGIKGVHWNKASGKFMAYIKVDYRLIHLGSFGTLSEATAARHAAEIKYFGPFRRSLPPTETPHDPH